MLLLSSSCTRGAIPPSRPPPSPSTSVDQNFLLGRTNMTRKQPQLLVALALVAALVAPVAVAQTFDHRHAALWWISHRPVQEIRKGMAHGEALLASRSTAPNGSPSLDRRDERNGNDGLRQVDAAGRTDSKRALLRPREPWKVPLHWQSPIRPVPRRARRHCERQQVPQGQPVSYCPGPHYEMPKRIVDGKWKECLTAPGPVRATATRLGKSECTANQQGGTVAKDAKVRGRLKTAEYVPAGGTCGGGFQRPAGSAPTVLSRV